ncbi:MAG: carbohydrate ABC transporter permease [Deinococcota bacterium]
MRSQSDIYVPHRHTKQPIKLVLQYALLAIVAFLMAFPFLWMVLTTFKTSGNIFRLPPSLIPDKLFGEDPFGNYRLLFSDYNFLRYALNTFVVATLAALGQIITCSLAAFAFARLTFKGSRVIFGLLLATLVLPIEVTIVPEYLIALLVYEPALQAIGLRWIDSLAPLIVPSFFVGATGTFLLREFFSTIPRDLEEAAVIDGASVFAIYRRIFLPLATPALITLFLLAFITNWNDLLRAVLYIKSPNLRTLPIGLALFQDEYATQWDLLLAGSVVTILPLIIVYIFMQKYIVEGIATTGIK